MLFSYMGERIKNKQANNEGGKFRHKMYICLVGKQVYR